MPNPLHVPNPLQYLQHPGVILAGLMALAALIVLLTRGMRSQGDRITREVRFVSVGVVVTSIVLITIYGATAPNNPVTTGLSSWFALVAFGAGITALVILYKVWDDRSVTWAIDASLLGLTAMAYFTLACELFLVGRFDTGSWTGFVRRLPVVPLWVAAALIVLTVILLAADWLPHLWSSRKKPRPPAEWPTPRDR